MWRDLKRIHLHDSIKVFKFNLNCLCTMHFDGNDRLFVATVILNKHKTSAKTYWTPILCTNDSLSGQLSVWTFKISIWYATPDLVPSDFFYFPHNETKSRGKRHGKKQKIPSGCMLWKGTNYLIAPNTLIDIENQLCHICWENNISVQ